uniref:Cytochrome b5 heme-binding domain-containing protein n=1 Tax=Chromera velia CCMP2878 TaxID=1169474 RepID=A0A0G4HW29_9ALVE|eukprot:Cvel_8966.t1-p1 / transcript=Cvel_8966.t1 / gene=Cvel_8966 / organism=Chromera_velia_CCMP2878 / gene_product=Fatty acid desaturase 3, putative / transcript_product=Fatty acid desaturase 3, putative / location=Cvel_scaffold505:76498-79652(-) / protein_length=507 / sequence_SO=supercontig / SO=protein_coding / is_pseudo=false
MLIHDRVYDVSEFVRKHPGGSVIRYYLGQDATDAFEGFHQRSEKAHKWLKAIPSRPVRADDNFTTDTRSRELITNFQKFRQGLIDDGYFKPDYLHVVYRLIELVLMFALSFWLLRQNFFLLGIFVGGIASGRCGWVQHEGGHHSLTGKVWLDQLIQKVTISFGLVTSGPKWNAMHTKHHATPQKEDFDVDVDTLPFVAFYKEALERGRRIHMTPNWWLRYQHYTFLPVTSVFNVFFWHFYLHPREYLFKRPDPLTAVVVASRYIVHYACTLAVHGWFLSTWTLFASLFIAGIYLFGNFSLNHTHLPTTKADEERTWAEYGIDYTMNVDCNWFVNWWMGYLNCQIEHHLFPTMPQYKQPQIVERTRQFCQENGMKYQSMPYIKALGAMLGNLRNIAHQVDDVLPPLPERQRAYREAKKARSLAAMADKETASEDSDASSVPVTTSRAAGKGGKLTASKRNPSVANLSTSESGDGDDDVRSDAAFVPPASAGGRKAAHKRGQRATVAAK